MNGKKIVAAFAFVLLGIGSLAAQEQAAALRQRMRNNIGYLRLIRMTQALSLTEDQTSRIYPMFNKVEKEKLDLQKELAADLQDLRKILRTAQASVEVPETMTVPLAELVGRIGEKRRAIRAKDDALDEFLDKELNPLQKARYVLFQIEFNQGLGDMLERARGRRQFLPAPIKK